MLPWSRCRCHWKAYMGFRQAKQVNPQHLCKPGLSWSLINQHPLNWITGKGLISPWVKASRNCIPGSHCWDMELATSFLTCQVALVWLTAAYWVDKWQMRIRNLGICPDIPSDEKCFQRSPFQRERKFIEWVNKRTQATSTHKLISTSMMEVNPRGKGSSTYLDTLQLSRILTWHRMLGSFCSTSTLIWSTELQSFK